MSVDRGALHGPVTRGFRWLLSLAVLLGVVLAVARVESASASSLWSAPAQLRTIPWPATDAKGAWTLVDPTVPAQLAPKQLLLVPVRSGDIVELRARRFRVGHVFGSLEFPDAVIWHGEHTDAHRLRISTWGYTRFVAVEVTTEQAVEVRVAVPRRDPLVFHRLDTEIQAVLDGTGPAPAFDDAASENALHALLVRRDILSSLLADQPNDHALQQATLRWLAARWLLDTYRTRPLARPFFVERDVTVQGARELPQLDDSRTRWYRVEPGDALTLRADADVLRVNVRVWAGSDAHYQVIAGEELVADQVRRIPERGRSDNRWTPARSLRVALRRAEPIRVAALSGRLEVSVDALQAQLGLLEGTGARSPTHLLQAAHSAAVGATGAPAELLEAFIQDEQLRSDPSWAALARRLRMESRPAVRALLWSVLLPRFLPDMTIAEQLEDFWEASSALGESAATTLRHDVLSRIIEASDVPPIPSAAAQGLRRRLLEGVDELSAERALTHRALVDLVLPPRDGARPQTGAALERRAAQHPERLDFRRLAHSWWRRVSPWTTLEPEAASTSELRWEVPRPATRGRSCEVDGPVGLRWTVVDAERRSFWIQPTAGSHLSVPLTTLPPESGPATDSIERRAVPADSKVDVTGVPISVLATAADPSRVFLSKGEHTFLVTQGPPILARLPRVGSAACESLREARRWYQLEGPVTFPIPAGDEPTVASLVLEPSSIPRTGAELKLEVAGRTYEASAVRPGTGAVELPIPPGATAVTVMSEQPVLVRLRVRSHRAPEGVAAAAPAGGDAAPAPDFGQRVEGIRRATLALQRASSSAERDRWRSRRARLLQEVGYGSLAALDVARLSPVAGAKAAGLLSPPTVPAGEVWWPHRQERVIAGTRQSRVPLMPDDLSASELSHVAGLLRSRRDEAALRTLLTRGVGKQPGRGAQMLALLLEEAGRFAEAADIYERLGELTPAAEHIAAAAEMRTAQARQSRDLATTEQAHWLARQAVSLGARATPLLAPLGRSIRWTASSAASLGEGAAVVESVGENPRAESLSRQVRAALMAKPERSRWLTADESFGLYRLRGRRIELSWFCFSQVGPEESCEVELQLDGRPIECAAPAEAAKRSVSRPQTCQVNVPDRARTLTLRGEPLRRPLGWYVVSELEDDGTLRTLPVRQTYSRISPQVPLEMVVRAPTVVRLRARALGAEPSSMAVSAAPTAGGAERTVLGASQRWRVPLLGELDPHARVPSAGSGAAGAPQQVQYEVSDYLVLDGDGLHTLRVVPSRTGVMVKLELPIVRAPPAESSLDELTPPSSHPGAAVGWDGFAFATPDEPGRAQPFTASTDVALVDRDLTESDDDARDRHLEAALSLRRELVPNRVWGRVSVLGRLRDGPSSAGVDLAGSLASDGYVPGVFFRARAVAQPYPDVTAFGLRAMIGAVESIPLDSRWSLLPGAALTVRAPDERVLGRPGSDRDVASVYSETRPWSPDLFSSLLHRPYFDTRARYGALVRFDPGFSSIDRVQAEAQFDWLGGDGLAPWVTLEATAGYRPPSALRQDGFFRAGASPSVMFWHWLGVGGRLRAHARVGAYYDVPDESRPLSFFGALTLGYDFIAAQGVSDLPPLERPHRSRLEERSPRVTTASPPQDRYWDSQQLEDAEEDGARGDE